MKNRFKFIYIVMLILSVGKVYGFFSNDKSIKNKIKNINISKNIISPKNTCENFSGNWKGNCTVDGTSEPEAFQIEQINCDQITINSVDEMGNNNSESFELKGSSLKIQSSSDTSFSYSFSAAISWNFNRDKITLVMGGVSNSPGFDAPRLFEARTHMLKDGDELLVFSSSSGFDENEIKSCRLQKDIN